jgi:hypothetical protein
VKGTSYEDPHSAVFFSFLHFPLRSRFSPQHPVLKHSLCCTCSVGDRISQPYEAAGKIVFYILSFEVFRGDTKFTDFDKNVFNWLSLFKCWDPSNRTGPVMLFLLIEILYLCNCVAHAVQHAARVMILCYDRNCRLIDT